MKKIAKSLGITSVSLIAIYTLFLLAHNIPALGNKKAALIKSIEVVKIYEGGVKDIVFEAPQGDFYYINRGLEQGFTISDLERQVLNKTVTLRLTKMLSGVSSHIHQMEVDGTVVFSELN